jgi:hypothetical protein
LQGLPVTVRLFGDGGSDELSAAQLGRLEEAKRMSSSAVATGQQPASISEGLSVRDLRWIADAYEQAQRVRVETGERIRAILQGRDERGDAAGVDVKASDVLAAIRRGQTEGPVPLLGRTYRRHADEERELRRAMLAALTKHPAWPWLARVRGIGATLAAKLLARLDVMKARSPSSFWSYCGLATVPGIEYRCAQCGLRASFPVRYRVKGTHTRPESRATCAGALVPYSGPEHGVRVAQPRPAAGERACYDQYAKKVCYLIGVSFLRSGSAYERYYRDQRGRLEKERPGWTPGRVHFAALRKTEKLFLAQLWVVWREAMGMPSTTPYAHAILKRDDYLPPQAMVEENLEVAVEP